MPAGGAVDVIVIFMLFANARVLQIRHATDLRFRRGANRLLAIQILARELPGAAYARPNNPDHLPQSPKHTSAKKAPGGYNYCPEVRLWTSHHM
jgi:hypothetical protein